MSSPTPVPHAAAGIPTERLAELDRLLEGLDGVGLGFVAGYVTARARGAAPLPAQASGAADPQRRITVLYGSQTGNGRRLAEKFGRTAEAAGVPARVVNAGEYAVRELAQERLLVLFVSTHGDGDPPDDARPLLEFLHSRRAPRLEQLSYAVCALGDSSYPKFCETGRVFDARLAQLGGRALLARAEADGDPQASVNTWLDEAFARARVEVGAETTVNPPALPALRLVPTASAVTRDEPLAVEVLANHPITGRGATREVRHVELAAPAASLGYQPGDSLGIWPRNPASTVNRLLELLGASSSEPVAIGSRTRTLREWLTEEREVTRLSRPVLDAHARRSGSKSLQHALEPENSDALRALFEQLQLVDLLVEYPARWDPADLVATLRPLTPRLYSISSSSRSVGEEIHLTVAIVNDERNGYLRPGAASGLIAHEAREGSFIKVYVEPNTRFRLPRDPERDVILIGPGTGVAPFRAFVQDRAAQGAAGRTWLFFGGRNFDTDFLYQAEWLEHLKRGELTRLDVAFSRDQDRKVYVQHRISERAAELWQWLQDGAAIYVCGDATRMAHDVHAALANVLVSEGGLSAADAEEHLATLAADRRYLRDVY